MTPGTGFQGRCSDCGQHTEVWADDNLPGRLCASCCEKEVATYTAREQLQERINGALRNLFATVVSNRSVRTVWSVPRVRNPFDMLTLD